MRVKCLFNSLQSLPDSGARDRLAHRIHRTGPIDGLDVGREYFVQAFYFSTREALVYLERFADDDYPVPWPIEFFHVLDSTMPSHWITREYGDGFLTSFPLWAGDRGFYERLIDGTDGGGAAGDYAKNRIPSQLPKVR